MTNSWREINVSLIKSGKLINAISKAEKGNPDNIGKVTWIIMTKQKKMKQKFTNNIFIFNLLIASVFLFTISCSRSNQYPDGIKHVIIIGIDGMSVQGFLEAETPCMDSLLQNGAYNYKVRSVLPSVSTPNWNAMLCGAGPEITGVIDNSWERGIDNFPPVAVLENNVSPNIFSVIRQQKPDAEIGCFNQWAYFKTLLDVESMSRFETCETALDDAQKTASYIQDKKPDFVFVHVDDVDAAGHESGWMSAEYIKAIHEVDGDVRIIVNAVKKAGISDHTMIMVVADHGGIFFRHGKNTYEELTTPIIYSGCGIKKGYQIKQQIYKYDVAADVAFALGLKMPQIWTGRPVKAAFKGFDEPENIYQGIDILPPPVFVSKEVKTVYGGLWVDTTAEVKIKCPLGVEGDIRYTTDETIPTRKSALYAGPFTLGESAVVNARIFGKGGKAESPMVSAQYRVVDSKNGNGVNYSFFSLPGEKNIPSFASKTPVGKGVCYEIGLDTPEINILKKKYNTDYGMCFTGWLKVDFDANYTFRIWSDGGYRLFINSTLVTENDILSGSNSDGTIKLAKGSYPFKIEYFTHEKSGSLDVYYEAPGMPSRFLSGDKLFREQKFVESK